MRTLYHNEFKIVSGGTRFGAELERLKGRIRREVDRNVKDSIERQGGDTSDMDMEKAHKDDDKRVQQAKEDRGHNLL